MSAPDVVVDNRIRLVVAEDRLRAWAEFRPGPKEPTGPPTEEQVLAALTRAGIRLTDEVRARVREFVPAVAAAGGAADGEQMPAPMEPFLIAEGLPPVEARDGDFEWSELFERQEFDPDDDAPADYYNRNSIVTVEAGTVVGRLRPPVDGQIGVDVFGCELRPRRLKGLAVKLGTGLTVAADDPSKVVTELPGRVVRDGNTLVVHEVLTIGKDVDFESGNIDACVDVEIRGGVKPNFSVRTGKSLTIRRAVEAAEVIAAGDIVVRGGVFGHGRGKPVRAGGTLSAAICDAADLAAEGDIRVGKEIVNSSVSTNGWLLIERGAIVGGTIYARRGIKARVLGSPLGVRTRIRVGPHPAVLCELRRLERLEDKQRRRAGQARRQLELLVSHAKRMTEGQRAQAERWKKRADALERAAQKLAAERAALLEAAGGNENPTVEAAEQVHPGVALSIGTFETVFRDALRGPIRLELRQVGRRGEILAVDPASRAATTLPTTRLDMGRLHQAAKEAQLAPPASAAK